MSGIYFFNNDQRCKFVQNVLNKDFFYYVQENESTDGKHPKYYINLEWSAAGGKGVNIPLLEKLKIRYISNIGELPDGCGVYVTTYDGNQLEIDELKKKGIPLIEEICPWVIALKRQLQKLTDAYQCILMIDEDHMVYSNYKSLIPSDAIIINEANFESKLGNSSVRLPVHLIAYSTFRLKDVDRVIRYLETKYYNEKNIYWSKGICQWITKTGLFEEINHAITNEKLDEVWVICGSESNRSVKSIINEIIECQAKPIVIKNVHEVPRLSANKRIGVLKAPIPFSEEDEILEVIKERHA